MNPRRSARAFRPRRLILLVLLLLLPLLLPLFRRTFRANAKVCCPFARERDGRRVRVSWLTKN